MDACDLTATEARRLIGTKRLSPLELTERCIARIEAVDHAVNALPARDFTGAREAARKAEQAVTRGDALGALHGLPVVVKDLEDAAGFVTSHGSPIHAGVVATKDQRAVAAIRAAGGIIIAKSNVPEFGAGANTRNAVYGATGNAFDPARSAAGSSGGSAAALACGMAPLATGSDMGGSLRNPAAFNGVVGFRPTPGLVANEKAGFSPLSVLGPMGRTVGDAALLLSVMASDDKRDPMATTVHGQAVRRPEQFARPVPCDLSALRVALTPDFGFAPTERHVAEVFAEKTGLFRGTFGKAVDAAPNCAGADESFEVLRSLAFLAKHAESMRTRPQDLGPNIHANFEEGQRYTAADAGRAMAQQAEMYRRWQVFFDDHDVVLSPAITISPRPWTELYPAEIDGRPTRTYFHWLSLAYCSSLVGHPSLSLPVGLDRADMPFGLQIVGPRGGDALVLSVASALERHLADDDRTARPVPDLAALRNAPPIADMPGFMGFG